MVLGNPPECSGCREKKRQALESKSEVKALSQTELKKRKFGSIPDLHTSLLYFRSVKVPAFYVSAMTVDSHGFGSLVTEDMKWARTVFEVLKTHFTCNEPKVFAGLVIFAGDDMVFTGPGQSAHGSSVPSPSISITPLEQWQKNVGGGSLKDWTCVVCHEVIHYLHWRWDIIPCDPSLLSEYEDQVSGQLLKNGCRIPHFAQKEANGLLELADPVKPFTENGFRNALGLKLRKSYNDTTAFTKM